MSYILEALRRADAERGRGAVPGLHSQSAAAAQSPAQPAAGGRRAVWIAVGAAFALLSGAVYFWLQPTAPLRREAALTPAPATGMAPTVAALPQQSALPAPLPAQAREPGMTAAPQTPEAPVVVAAAPGLSSRAAEKTMSARAAPAAGTATPPTALSSSPMTSPLLLPSPALAPRQPTAVATRDAAPRETPGALPPQPQRADVDGPPAAARAAADRPVPYAQLPDDVKRELPALSIGGAVYSDNPGSRMLMIGGQLLHEGDAAAPGLTLEQIKPKSAVLRWKQLRFEMAL